MTRTKYDLLRT